MRPAALPALLLSAALSACTFDPSWDGIPEETSGLADLEVRGLLMFLNNQNDTDFDRLDVDCALRSDAALNLIEHRDGQDGRPGTDDDDLFESVSEIESVYMVGPRTLELLFTCADSFGYINARQCTAPAFDPSEEFDVAYVDRLEALPPELLPRVEELGADAVRFADPTSPNPVRFVDLSTYLVDGAPVFHQVTFAQTVDADSDVEIEITYDLDACLRTTDINISI